MKRKMKKYIYLNLITLLIPLIGMTQENVINEVKIRNTQVRTIASSIVENTIYEIHISLPDGYSRNKESYPVLYYLDAYHWGGTVIETYRLLRAFNDIRPLVLVGISYKDATREEESYYRNRDLLPTVITKENTGPYTNKVPSASGGASSFLKFIKEELKPMIRSNYRVQKKGSGILGISNGALFATYAMFTDSNEFDNYILGSPRFDRDNFIVLEFEKAFYSKTKSLPVNVFLSVGSEEWEFTILSWIKLRDRLKQRDYEGMNLIVTTFNGETHTSGIPATISRGIRELYKIK